MREHIHNHCENMLEKIARHFPTEGVFLPMTPLSPCIKLPGLSIFFFRHSCYAPVVFTENRSNV